MRSEEDGQRQCALTDALAATSFAAEAWRRWCARGPEKAEEAREALRIGRDASLRLTAALDALLAA